MNFEYRNLDDDDSHPRSSSKKLRFASILVVFAVGSVLFLAQTKNVTSQDVVGQDIRTVKRIEAVQSQPNIDTDEINIDEIHEAVLWKMPRVASDNTAECSYFERTVGPNLIGRYVVNECSKISSGLSIQYVCDTAGTSILLELYFGSVDCTGGMKMTSNVTSQALSFNCGGSTCAITSDDFDGAVCAGVATRSLEKYVDPTFCETFGIKHYCDATDLYSYHYGNTNCTDDGTSPAAFIRRLSYSACSPSHNFFGFDDTVSKKEGNCQKIAAMGAPTLTLGANILTAKEYSGENCPSGNLGKEISERIEVCWPLDVFSVNLFCSNGNTKAWRYVYNSGDCSTSLVTATYLNTGCNVEHFTIPLMHGFRNSTSTNISCSGSVAPPTISFGSSESAVVEVYSDSACTQLYYGTHMIASATCAKNNRETSFKISCGVGGTATASLYHSNGDCIGTPTDVVLNSGCTKVPGTEVALVLPIYAKLVSCA